MDSVNVQHNSSIQEERLDNSIKMPDNTNSGNNGGPLPLTELKRWMSEDVHSWIKEGDEKQAQLDRAFEETAYQRLFGEYGSDSEDENDDDDEVTKQMSAKEKKYLRRIRHWSSSTTSPDGIGGFQPRESSTSSDNNSNESDEGVQIVYMLSESAEGFGGILWSSARCIANTIADPALCRELLSPIMDSSKSFQQHPLQGVSFLEIGAGAGVPSWAAMKCGAHVVSTDLSDTDRIRCLAECAERNFQQILQSNAPDEKKETLLAHASKTRVCPHDWGSSVEGVVKALNSTSDSKEKQQLFEVIIAADCCYMPWWHKEMLESIYNLLSEGGVTIVAFALHGNTDDDDVWKIVDRAKDRGFCVEALDSQQLSPPYAAMESKQGLVHILRLTKPATSS